ncbi:hypothetical protein LOK49_LG01G03981 [Camellia lanceoleosa]|uniref:Uncharacterized protein n=1 Tax=Camellia lanceoleosa TaxID=1840588 RepID=A0ACC0IZ19_9ERIC|nr:hypothetical protein LOK49_LG01G03981 [Camellia lanceoleosa]
MENRLGRKPKGSWLKRKPMSSRVAKRLKRKPRGCSGRSVVRVRTRKATRHSFGSA